MNEQKRTIQRKNEKMRCNENMKACEQRGSVEVCTHPSNPTIHPYPSLNYFTACSTFINQSSSEFLLKFKGKINITMEKCCLIAPCHLRRRLRTVSFFPWSVKRNARDTKMTTCGLPPSFLARVLLLLNPKKRESARCLISS